MRLRRLRDDSGGFASFFLVFVLLGTMLLFLFAIACPFLISFSSHTYLMGQEIMENTMDDLEAIENETIREEIIGTINQSQAATAENIDMLSFFFQYGWVLIIVIVSVVMWMLARRTSEMYQVV